MNFTLSPLTLHTLYYQSPHLSFDAPTAIFTIPPHCCNFCRQRDINDTLQENDNAKIAKTNKRRKKAVSCGRMKAKNLDKPIVNQKFRSFAFHSISERWPKIVAGIVDKLHRYHHKAVEELGEVNFIIICNFKSKGCRKEAKM